MRIDMMTMPATLVACAMLALACAPANAVMLLPKGIVVKEAPAPVASIPSSSTLSASTPTNTPPDTPSSSTTTTTETDGIDYPYPNYNAFRVYTMLPGTRKTVTLPSAQPDVGAFASADATSAGLLAYNYNFRFNWPSAFTDLAVNENVAPAFTNIPFGGTVGVERYLVDQDSSNIAMYLDNGTPLSYDGTMLKRVESCAATSTRARWSCRGACCGRRRYRCGS